MKKTTIIILIEAAFLWICMISCKGSTQAPLEESQSLQWYSAAQKSADVPYEEIIETEYIYKIVKLTDEKDRNIYVLNSFLCGDEWIAHRYTPYTKDGINTTRRQSYDLQGNLKEIQSYPDILNGAKSFAILPNGETAVIGAAEDSSSRLAFSLYDETENLLAQSAPFSVSEGGTYRGLYALGETIVYTNGSEMFLWQYPENTEPQHMILPCEAEWVKLLADGRFLIRDASFLTRAEDLYYVYDPHSSTVAKYSYSDTVQSPSELFADVLDTEYFNGKFYGLCQDGLYVWREEESTAELLVQWDASNVDGTAVKLCAVLSRDCYYILYADAMNRSRNSCFLVRTEEQRTKPREVVSFAAAGLDDVHRELLSSAVLQYNRDHADYKIRLTDYETLVYQTEPFFTDALQYETDEEWEAAWHAAAQARLEADLLSGVVYDGYFLPEKSSVRTMLSDKRLLSDLTPYIKEGQLLGCVETAYTTQNGMTALPFFMRLSTLVTSQFVLPTTTRLTRDVLYDMAEHLGDGEALFDTDVYEALKTVGQYDFINENAKSCTFDSPEFTEYLDFLFRVKAGAYTDETTQIIREYQYQTQTKSQEFVLTSLNALTKIGQNRAKFTEFQLYSQDALAAMLLRFKGQNINYCGYPSDSGTTVILSSDTMFSLSHTARCPLGAVAFMQYLLSDEIQTCRMMREYGLPAARSAMEKTFPVGYIYYKNGTRAHITVDGEWYAYHPEAVTLGYMYQKDWISQEEQETEGIFTSVFVQKEDCDLFIRFLDRATVKTSSDAALAEILDEELSYAESGARSAAQTGEVLQSRVFIYLNE